jgi:hypothetical protein
LKTAREYVRVARAAHKLPRTTAALQSGTLSYSKARAITRVARPETEEKLIAIAESATASQLERILSAVRRADSPAERNKAEEIEARRNVDAFFDDDGMLVLRARLAPDDGALFLRALDSARDTLFRADKAPSDQTPGQRRADALVLVADRSLSEGATGRNGGDRVTVMLHVDEAVLADPEADGQSRLDGGPESSAEASRRLACDAAVVRVTHAENGELHTGRRARLVSATLRRALDVRDGGCCTFPGCSRRIVDAHHIVHWANGGPTVLSNLCQLCRQHHILVHEGGYRMELTDRGARFYRPDGTVLPDTPAPRVENDALGALSRQQQQQGLAIDPLSLLAHDASARVDMSWIVSLMTD